MSEVPNPKRGHFPAANNHGYCYIYLLSSHSSRSPPPSTSSLHFFFCAFAPSQHITMATNALSGTSLSMRSLTSQTQAFTSLSGQRSGLISSFGRKNVSFNFQPRQIRLQISCAAKADTVDKVCEIVKKQLAVAEGETVTAESTFQKLGADSLDTVEIVMALEEAFGIAIEEESAQTITTVQQAADLIEDIIDKKSS
uniref:Acyl carrier protein n=2 Tax=Phaseolus vulgaris TaxID=3885 RepID=V7BR98_PHAVU|nr:hypothetical protein PHAVU_006G096600g [Phaseolus vulgaris]ESW19101.1 hypothetical protein PHAVU_006G096600g [Phaseolus vulgaris]